MPNDCVNLDPALAQWAKERDDLKFFCFNDGSLRTMYKFV